MGGASANRLFLLADSLHGCACLGARLYTTYMYMYNTLYPMYKQFTYGQPRLQGVSSSTIVNMVGNKINHGDEVRAIHTVCTRT